MSNASARAPLGRTSGETRLFALPDNELRRQRHEWAHHVQALAMKSHKRRQLRAACEILARYDAAIGDDAPNLTGAEWFAELTWTSEEVA